MRGVTATRKGTTDSRRAAGGQGDPTSEGVCPTHPRDRRHEGRALCALGRLNASLDRPGEACATCEEGEALLRELEQWRDLGEHVCSAGLDAARRGDLVGARTRLAEAETLEELFEKDVLECARCKGRLALIATITQPSVIEAMLACIGLPARPPPLAPARGPWQEELEFDGA